MKFKTTILSQSPLLACLITWGLLCSATRGICQTPIACGQTVTGTTTSPSQIVSYSYAGSAGEVLSIALWGPVACTSGGEAMVADVYNPGGQLLTNLSAGCSGAALNLALTDSGVHTILVHDLYYRSTGSYSLSIQSVVAGGCNPTAITCGQTVVTNTSFRSQMDAYSYVGGAGEVLSIALWGPVACTSGGEAMVADVYNPGGQLLTNLSAGCSGAALNLALTDSDVHTILVHDLYYRSTASYALSIQSLVGGGCRGATMPCGETVTGQISLPSQMNSYRIQASAGEHVILSDSGFSDMVLNIYDPAGNGIVTMGSSIATNYTFPTSGIYTVLVHSGSYAGTGSYNVSLTALGGCTQLYVGQDVIRTQQVGCVFLRLAANSPVVWVSFAVEAPAGILENASLSAISAFTNATITPGTGSKWFVTMQTSPSSGVMGDPIIGSLCFAPTSTQSIFAPLVISDLVITNQGGSVPGTTGHDGRAVVIADQCLLEAGLTNGTQRTFTLFGKGNADYEMEYSTNLAAVPPWIIVSTNTLPSSGFNTSTVQGPWSNAPSLFIRANER